MPQANRPEEGSQGHTVLQQTPGMIITIRKAATSISREYSFQFISAQLYFYFLGCSYKSWPCPLAIFEHQILSSCHLTLLVKATPYLKLDPMDSTLRPVSPLDSFEGHGSRRVER